MANLHINTLVCRNGSISVTGLLAFPFRTVPAQPFFGGRIYSKKCLQGASHVLKRTSFSPVSKKFPRCSVDKNETSNSDKTPFGYTRKDVIVIGVGLTALGIGLKSGLEYLGVDPLQAGNVVQLVLVLGLTVGWISTYIFRVSNKEMTYAQQLRDYEDKVMQKRLESLTEAEIQALLEQVEEEKQRLGDDG
ncbi:hypothetical protein ACS0TY_034035 [Phlomoides rotata]